MFSSSGINNLKTYTIHHLTPQYTLLFEYFCYMALNVPPLMKGPAFY